MLAPREGWRPHMGNILDPPLPSESLKNGLQSQIELERQRCGTNGVNVGDQC